VEAFALAAGVRAAVIVAPRGLESEIATVAAQAIVGGALDVEVVAGGATRAESVSAGLSAVADEVVAVHDAARPLVTPDLITALLRALGRHPHAAGVIAASPIADTVKRVREGDRVIERTESREGLWAAETPQVFRTELLRRAHSAFAAGAPGSATDDSMLVEADGGTVLIEHVSHPNLKVTTPSDLRIAELLLAD
jgi:2-C-methyl-D-erythritol 4-phosphate cytidylyltransferase